MIRVFDISRPGSDYTERPTCQTRRSRAGQRGIISNISFSPFGKIFAAASFAGTTMVYDDRFSSCDDNSTVFDCSFLNRKLNDKAHPKGVTQVQFSPHGGRIFTGGRNDKFIYCWDLRLNGKPLFRLCRNANTSQKFSFDIDSQGRWLVSSDSKGNPRIYDLRQIELDFNFEDVTSKNQNEVPTCNDESNVFGTFRESVNGAQFHPTRPIIGFTTGQRHFHFPNKKRVESSDEDEEEEEDYKWQQARLEDNSLSFFNLINV
eukprot:g3267.t1